MSSSSPALLSCIVSKGSTILAQYRVTVGAYTEVIPLVLARLKVNQERECFTHNDLVYSCLTKQGFTILGVSKSSLEVYNCLQNVMEKFLIQFGRRGNGGPFSLHTEFSPIMAREVDMFNRPHRPDKLASLHDEISQVYDTMVDNINVIIARGERMELLVDKTDKLSANSVSFVKTSKTVQKSILRKHMCVTIGTAVAVIILLYIFLVWTCSGWALTGCI